MPKFKFYSLFSAKNPAVNDASGITMLFAEAGMIFGVPAEQQQCATCLFSPQLSLIQFFRERKWKTRSGSRAE